LERQIIPHLMIYSNYLPKWLSSKIKEISEKVQKSRERLAVFQSSLKDIFVLEKSREKILTNREWGS